MVSNLWLTDVSRHISKSRQWFIADNYRYIILAIFEYRNITLADTITFTELGDLNVHPVPSIILINHVRQLLKKNRHAK